MCDLLCIRALSMSFISSDGYRGDARGAQALTLFLDQTETRRAAKMFFETIPPSPPPLSEGLDPPLIIVVSFNPSNSM